MKHLVIGRGEIGSAIEEVLKKGKDNEVYYIDKGINKNIPPDAMVDFMHVCIPYSDNFIKQIEEYADRWLHKTDGITIVHSTVPQGTSRKLKSISSPCRGVHPNLVKGIMTFTKYFGGLIEDDCKRATKVFSDLGIVTESTYNPDNCEVAKLVDTTQLGWFVILNKEIKKLCEKRNVDFDFVYRDVNISYNEGYVKLGMEHVVRPYLEYKDGPIGGHCVIPNLKYLEDSIIANFIKMMNDIEVKMEVKSGN
jgi:hypothetical protein